MDSASWIALAALMVTLGCFAYYLGARLARVIVKVEQLEKTIDRLFGANGTSLPRCNEHTLSVEIVKREQEVVSERLEVIERRLAAVEKER